ncbi:MAG: putative acyl-CoA dehydrogenase, partial [Planctomycetaceae bacterium]|nr:putative acyl-CoA dehydrogenase [Planctomycetaceae bacterium]
MTDYRLIPRHATAAQADALRRIDLACQELRPIEDRYYLDRRINSEVPQLFAKHGVLGFMIPQEYGGLGTDVPLYAWGMERIGQEGTGPRTFFSCHISIGSSVVVYWGNSEQKQRYLPDAATGKRIFGFGLTEPDAGSNPAAMQTRFEKTSAGYVLNG